MMFFPFSECFTLFYLFLNALHYFTFFFAPVLGVERETARKFVAAFYASLAHGTELSSETLEGTFYSNKTTSFMSILFLFLRMVCHNK